MLEGYLSMEEVAGLEDVGYTALSNRMHRNPEQYKTIQQTREGGGKPEVFISISSLSPKARQRYRRQKKKEEAEAMKTPVEAVPWYVKVEVGWFRETYREEFDKAADILYQVEPILHVQRSKRRAVMEEAAQILSVSTRTIDRYLKAIGEAKGWEQRKLAESNWENGFTHFSILALCREPKERQTFPSLPEEQKALIKSIWFDRGFAQNLNTKEQLYRIFSCKAEQLGWQIPSQKTVARFISSVMQEPDAQHAHYLAAHGERAYKNKLLPKGLRDTKSLKVLEFVQGDAHTFDCFVEYTDTNGNKKAIRPVLVAWIDTRSRCIMGHIICKTSSADVIQQSIIKMIYSDIGGVPQELHIDNGKDFTAERNTGQKRSERTMSFDALVKGLYRGLGIESYSRARPYEPWSKGEMERYFRTVCEQYTKMFESYTGTLTGSRTICKRSKDIGRMLERGELVTMEEFAGLFDRFLEEYHHRKHRGLSDAGEEYQTPLEVYRHAERYEKADILPDRELARVMLMPMETATVYNYGIRRFKTSFSDDALAPYIGQRVNIRYDPQDLRVIYVYAQDGRKICEATDKGRLSFHDEEQAAKHIQRQRHRMKEVRDRLEEYVEGGSFYQTQLEEKARAKAESMVGRIDLDSLTVKKTVEQRREESKAIPFPDDKEFREDKRQEREETNIVKTNPLLQSMYRKALQPEAASEED